VLAIGPLARDAAKSFEQFWDYRHSVASRDLIDVAAAMTKGGYRRYETRADYDFGSFFGALDGEANDGALMRERFAERLRLVKKAAFVSDEPGKKRGFFFGKAARITRELKATLEEARSSVVMQTPYLVLSNPARDLFREMQRKHTGLRIKVSSNSFASTDNIMAYSGNYRLRNRYVQDLKLQVHEFKPEPASMGVLFPTHPEMERLGRLRIAAGKQKRMPFLCIHAKSLVVDDRIAFVGSYNLDPRSENLNTEVGLLVEDDLFARELREEIERDMLPENSWVIARRVMPLGFETVNGLIGGIVALSPLDVWPIQNTSSFELRPGAQPVSPNDPAFHDRYREVGSFPGTEGMFTTKEILTRIYKAVGSPLTPIL
jgi:phosphatidylserine/phosphatidylglycerophosphate/cardiolipin synthase-like enzyme